MTSKINRSIAYCVLFVIEVSDASVIRHTTSASLRNNYRYRNKLGQCSVLRVRDGSKVEGDWLCTSVSVTIVPVLGRVSQWPHKKCNVQCVKETRGRKKAQVPTRKGEANALTTCSVNGVSVGLRVLEALLSTRDCAIHAKLFFAPLLWGTHNP